MGEKFILKRVRRNRFERAVQLAAAMQGSRRLRLHVDSNEQWGVLLYPYYTHTLDEILLLQPGEVPATLSLIERKKVLWMVGEAIQELHAKDWTHNGTRAAV